jgi:hypothetical protein
VGNCVPISFLCGAGVLVAIPKELLGDWGISYAQWEDDWNDEFFEGTGRWSFTPTEVVTPRHTYPIITAQDISNGGRIVLEVRLSAGLSLHVWAHGGPDRGYWVAVLAQHEIERGRYLLVRIRPPVR